MKPFLFTAALVGACWTVANFSHAQPKTQKTAKTRPAIKKQLPALVVQGRVKTSTKPPRPGSVPYKDAVIALHLTGVKASRGKSKREIVVFVWGMRNNRWTPAASFAPGRSISLRLTPWEKAERKYGRYNRFELQDEATFDLDTYWGE